MELKQVFKILVSSILFIGGILAILTWSNFVQAGFGVSPPWVIAEHLLKGSHFEQTIYLVQGQPDKNLIARIEIDESVIKDWISVDRGMEFKIPAGIQQFPIKIIIDVPKNVDLGEYKSMLRIEASAETLEQGVINVALGGVIKLNLRVTEEEFLSFIIRRAKVKKIETMWPVKIDFNVENTGNVKGRPTKATLEVWDIGMNKMLESGEFTDFDYVKPFETKGITAEFPSQLGINQYWAIFKIYHNDTVLRHDKQVFDVLEEGSLSGWRGVVRKIGEWFTWLRILYIFFVLIILGFLVWLKQKFKIKIINIIKLPVQIFKKLIKIRISFKE